jgi:hypothetical protein
LAVLKPEDRIRLDLNNPVFQEPLLMLQKAERHAAPYHCPGSRRDLWEEVIDQFHTSLE